MPGVRQLFVLVRTYIRMDYIVTDSKLCKKLSISAGGDRKKLRRLSRMARHSGQGSLEEFPGAFFLCSDLGCDAKVLHLF
jgi:hypothetical protein